MPLFHNLVLPTCTALRVTRYSTVVKELPVPKVLLLAARLAIAGEWQKTNTNTVSLVTCGACQRKACFIHEAEWHEGQTCAQVDLQTAETRRLEQDANAAYLTANTKTSPNKACGRPIEKNGGCQHMTCESVLRSCESFEVVLPLHVLYHLPLHHSLRSSRII